MPLWAVRLNRIVLSNVPAPTVFTLSYGLQVVRVDTRWIAAKVIQHQAFWYRTPFLLKNGAMRIFHAPVYNQKPITKALGGAKP